MTTSVQVVLITGKGGVGKTTVAGATASRCAAFGDRTLVVSTDAAHSLADAFQCSIGAEPTPIATDLWGQQVDARREVERHWSDIRAYLGELLEWAGGEGLAAEELLVVPGMQEVFALETILSHAEREQFDRIVVDCAPSAETLRLLELPDVVRTYLDRIFPSHRRIARLTRPLLRRTVEMPLADDEVFVAFERFMERLGLIASILRDPERSTARIVVTPERMVVDEAKRLYAHLSLFGYVVDSVVVNRELPIEECGTPLLDSWQERQRDLISEIETSFPSTQIRRLHAQVDEPLGHQQLDRLGAAMYGERDPGELVVHRNPIRFERTNGTVDLVIELPGLRPSEVDVMSGAAELVVDAGSERRTLPLPDSLCNWRPGSAEYDGTELRVTFEPAREVPFR